MTAVKVTDTEVTAMDPRLGSIELVSILKRLGLTCGTAESLTGGLICAEISKVPGSSEVLRGSIVAYSAEVKRTLLAVPGEAIEAGVVSEPIAIAMAKGGLGPLGADIVLSCTGVAGPGSHDGVAAGTVWIACASKHGYVTEKLNISGDRNEVRTGTFTAAIDLAISFLSNN